MTPMNDDQLLSLLADSVPDARPPADAVDAAYAAYGWRTLEADLAQLITDSHVEVVGFRDGGYSRVVTYETGLGTVTVSIAADEVVVDVTPAPTSLTLRTTGDARDLAIDGDGRATLEGVSGSIRFELTWPGGTATTPWLTL